MLRAASHLELLQLAVTYWKGKTAQCKNCLYAKRASLRSKYIIEVSMQSSIHTAGHVYRISQYSSSSSSSSSSQRWNGRRHNVSLCPHLQCNFLLTYSIHLWFNITPSDQSPVPARLAVQLNITSWQFQNLSKHALNKSIELTSTTWLGKLFQIFTILDENEYFLISSRKLLIVYIYYLL